MGTAMNAVPRFNRAAVRVLPLSERKDKVTVRDMISPDTRPANLSDNALSSIGETVERMVAARDDGRSRMITFGAHAIKNGLSPVLIKLIESGWVTHLATNGAGIIHDWEFTFKGSTSEDVRENVKLGRFGTWDETGKFLNLALAVGAYEGLGYGASVGKMVQEETLDIPTLEHLWSIIRTSSNTDQIASAADLISALSASGLSSGSLSIAHPYKEFGLQAAAYRLGVPLTGHPMIGHDIIYTHPMCLEAAIGRAAGRDFLSFAHSVSNLDGGVYMSIGSAVMSPMVFEKSLSMSQNLAIQAGTHIDSHFMTIVDLAESHWDWTKGEPPMDNPDYYLRYNKSFNRMGGSMRYLTADNRDFLLALWQGLRDR